MLSHRSAPSQKGLLGLFYCHWACLWPQKEPHRFAGATKQEVLSSTGHASSLPAELGEEKGCGWRTGKASSRAAGLVSSPCDCYPTAGFPHPAPGKDALACPSSCYLMYFCLQLGKRDFAQLIPGEPPFSAGSRFSRVSAVGGPQERTGPGLPN